jgi:hypothetical protein
VSGLRTTGPWAGLVVRHRVRGRALRRALGAAAVGEMVADKLPFVPPRSDPPALAGRVISGAVAGRVVAGLWGAGVGAAAAAATTYPSQRARALLGEHTPFPDAAIALMEDAVVLGTATVAAQPSDGPEPVAPAPSDGDEAAAGRRTWVTACALGLLAAAAGTAAMTSVQVASLSLTGDEPSSAPGDVGRTILKQVAGQKVPRRRRAAFNQLMHVLYGTAWGAPFGVLQRSRSSGPRTAALGLGFGTAVWGISLVELPLLGVAPPPWRQPPGSLARDLAFHLVYGTSTAAVHAALAA